jgi:hypothetical protein
MFSQKRIVDEQNNPTMKSLRSFKSITFKEKDEVIYKYPNKQDSINNLRMAKKADADDCCIIMWKLKNMSPFVFQS